MPLRPLYIPPPHSHLTTPLAIALLPSSPLSLAMEGALLASPLRVRVPRPVQCPWRSLFPADGASAYGRMIASARAKKSLIRKAPSLIVYPSDSIADATEVLDWESGMSMDDIAAGQGIRIRRRPPGGYLQQHTESSTSNPEREGNAPRNILEEIVWYKDIEVAQFQKEIPIDLLKRTVDNAPPARDFIGALKNSYARTGAPALIAEVKKASPSRGILRDDFDPVEIARTYEKGGAACLSVLTDGKFFQGSFNNLEAIRSNGVNCPLLCKEFIVDPWQIYYARSKGADAVLLIAAVLLDVDIKYFSKICRTLGMTALIEVHDEREMDRVLDIDGIQLIGINNRNLETFEVDISNTKKLLEGENGEIIREKGIMVVGESGLFIPEDVAYVQEAGVQAVLVGESLVKQKDPGQGIAGLFGKDISP